MRKILGGVLAFSVLAALASADILEFRPYAGYTTVNMNEINNDVATFNNTLDTIELLLFTTAIPPSSYTPLSDGFVLGGDLSSKRLLPWKSLSLDLRGEYLQTNQAEYRAPSFFVPGTTTDFTFQGTLSSALLGLFWQPICDGGSVDLSVGAFVGAGFGTMDRSIDFGTGAFTGHYTRWAAVGQLESRLNWHLSPTWTLSASGGYRLASLGQMFDSNGQPMKGIFAGSSLPIGNYALSADFSGITAAGSVSYQF